MFAIWAELDGGNRQSMAAERIIQLIIWFGCSRRLVLFGLYFNVVDGHVVHCGGRRGRSGRLPFKKIVNNKTLSSLSPPPSTSAVLHKHGSNMSATTDWITPSTRPELIENLVSGVGECLGLLEKRSTLNCACRQVQPSECWNP